MLKQKKYNPYLCLTYAIPLFVLSFAITYLYCVKPSSIYGSDYPAHIQFAKYFQELDFSFEGKKYIHVFSYPLFHIAVALIGFLIKDLNYSAIIVNIASLVATVFLLRNFARKYITSGTVFQQHAIDFFCVTSVIISGICGIVTQNKYYLPLGAPNVWHNPTYIFMRPFAIATLYFFVRYYETLFGAKLCSKNEVVRHGLCFSGMLFLSVLAKPNFALFFLISAGLVVAVSIIKQLNKNTIYYGFLVLLCVLPSIGLMLWQKWFCSAYSIVEFGLTFRPLSAIFTLPLIRGFVSLYLTSTLFFCAYGYKLIGKNILYTTIFIMLACSSFVWYGTAQGIDMFTDYAWSYFISLFLCSIISALYSVKHIKNKVYWSIFSCIWILQLIFGVIYMLKIIRFGDFNI